MSPTVTLTLARADVESSRLVRLRAARLIREINRRLDQEDNPAHKYGVPWREARLLMEALDER